MSGPYYVSMLNPSSEYRYKIMLVLVMFYVNNVHMHP